MQNNLPTDLIATALLANLASVKADIAARMVREYNETAARLAVTRTVKVFNRETCQFDQVTASGWGFDGITHRYNRFDHEMTRFAVSAVGDRTYINNTVYGMEINMAEVDAAAEREAAATLLMWHKKLSGKLGTVESCEVLSRGNYYYQITVRKAGVADEIRIEQQIVWKTAPRTRQWFAQFPARIYVGGKFTPEAQFKALCA